VQPSPDGAKSDGAYSTCEASHDDWTSFPRTHSVKRQSELSSRLLIKKRAENWYSGSYWSRSVKKDQVSGKIDQALGKVKQSVGDAVGNEDLANKGIIDQAKGAAKETWGNAKDAAQQVQESHKEAAVENSESTRDEVSQSIENTKDKIKGKIEEFKQRHSA
jgi:uncharacterized protein YjbJ (UPF0337 family)